MAGDEELAEDMLRLGYFAAEIVAETEAIDLDQVREFRATLPNGRPVDQSEARAWVNRHKAEVGRGMKRALAQEFKGLDSNREIRPGLHPAFPKFEPVWLEVVIVNREKFGRQRTRLPKVEFTEDSPLAYLAATADFLHGHFGWERGSAAGWLLCGSPPDPPAIKVTPMVASNIVEVPIWLPLNLVPRLIHVGAADDRAKRGPRLSKKLLEVTAFSVRLNDGRSWASVLREWNRIAPTEWQYFGPNARRHFARDARDTYRKLMGETFEWNRGGSDAES